jgi:hypothetical protein
MTRKHHDAHPPPARTRAGVEELLDIADRTAAQVWRPYEDHDRLLYDEDGLPK